MKKTFVLVLLAGVLALASLPTLTGIAMAETLTLKVVTAWPKNTTDNKSLFYFMESVEQQVAKKYPGELKLNLVGGPEAVKIQDQVHAAQTGMVDIVHTTNAYYVSVLPEVDALKQLSDELFDLAQIESGQAPLRLTSVNVPVLVDRTMARFGLMAERRQVVLVVGQVEKVDALVDADKFDKVLGNLVHNAIKFTPSGGCVTIDAQAADDMIEIRVQDTGQGIPAQDVPRIFERFYKVDRMRPRGEKGTGLGLAIARHLVEAHGGKIDVPHAEVRA